MTKIYKIKLDRTLILDLGSRHKMVDLKSNYPFRTANEDEQKAIEATSLFKSGFITLVETIKDETTQEKTATVATEETDKVIKTETQENVFADVTDLNTAAKILRAEPYKVNATKLAKQGVAACAAEKGVSFPNLKIGD
jgi:hypothetical protein